MAAKARQQRRRFSFRGRTVVITGGSRGLGLVIARRLAREGARIALLARTASALERAKAELELIGPEVEVFACDLRQEEEVNETIGKVADRFAGIDVLINNAGIIQVGPMEHITAQDFEDALAIHLFAPIYTTMAVLPHIRHAGQGRIVNISSIGGKIGVPHLVPYCASKFALTGFSEALGKELRRQNIFVTTVCPGLMRTGSPRNAMFKGQHRREYAWFSISDSLPLLSVSAEDAARAIVRACRRGSARLVIGTPARAAILMNELFPGTTNAMMALANRMLPGPAAKAGEESHRGYESESAFAPSALTRMTERAAAANNERAG